MSIIRRVEYIINNTVSDLSLINVVVSLEGVWKCMP